MRTMILSMTRRLAATLLLLGLPWAAQAALTLNIEANPSPVAPDQRFQVQLTVTNTTGVAVNGATVELLFPDNLKSLSDANASDGGDCPLAACDPGERLVWTLPTLQPGQGKTLSFTPVVATGVADGTVIPFDAEVLEGGVVTTTSSANVVVDGAPVLDLALAADRDPVPSDGEYTYTLTWGNRSGATVSVDTVVELQLPAGVSFVAADEGGVHSAGVVTWNLGVVPPGEGGRLRATVRVATGSGDGVPLVATALIRDQLDTNVIGRAKRVGRVQNVVPLDLHLTFAKHPAAPGWRLSGFVTVTNPGPVARDLVSLELRVPPGLAGFADSGVTGGGDCPLASCEAGERITWSIGTLPAGASRVFSLVPVVASGSAAGSVLPWEMRLADGTGENLRTMASVLVKDEGDVSMVLALRGDREPLSNGESTTWRIVWGNRSLANITQNTEVVLHVPPELTILSASDGGQFTAGGGEVRWDLGNTLPGESGQLSVRLLSATGLPQGALLSLRGEIRDGSGRLAEAARALWIRDNPPLDVAVALSPGAASGGERVDLELTVSNPSTLERNLVSVQLRYPTGFDSVVDNRITGGGDCPLAACDPGELITWNIATLPAGAAVTFSVPVTMGTGTRAGSIAQWEAVVVDGSGERLRAAAAVSTSSSPILELELAADADPTAPGELLTWKLTYSNRDPATTAAGARLSVTLPEGMQFVSASGDETVDPFGVVSWNLGDLAPGTIGQRELLVRTDALSEPGTLFDLQSRIDAQGHLQNRASRAIVAESLAPLALEVVAVPAALNPGDATEVQWKVTNNSPLDRFLVQLQARVPTGVNPIPEGDVGGGGTCPLSSCDPGELITWDLGTIPAGGTVTLTVPETIVSTAGLGLLVRQRAWLTDGLDARAVAHLPVMVGTPTPTFDVQISGTCPGTITMDVRNATPNGTLAIVTASQDGSFTVPTAPCQGMPLDMSGPSLFRLLNANGGGGLSVSQPVSAGQCGLYLQVVDGARCEPSILRRLP